MIKKIFKSSHLLPSFLILNLLFFFFFFFFETSLFAFFPFSSKTKSSILFYNISQDKIIYEKNSDLSLIPASIEKLITTATALDSWPSTKTFSTKFYYTKTFDPSGTITGDLIIQGGGDSYLTNEKMFRIVSDLSSMGIKNIQGDILIDNSLFDDDMFSSGRNSQSYSQRSYNAPVSAFAINFNTLTLSIYPRSINSKTNHPLVKMYPFDLNNVSIANMIKITQGTKSNLTLERTSNKDQVFLKISGTIGKDSKLRKKYCSISDPVLIAGEYTKAFLKYAGINVNGKISKIDSLPENPHLLLDFKGEPLFKLITSINQYSNNFMADSLLKSLGTLYSEKNSSLKDGIKIVESFLKEKVKLKGEFKTVDGSGLSSQNKISSRQIIDLLVYMSKRQDIFQEYLLSLAIPEESGSLEKRSYNQKIRAKTGTLTTPTAVANIAGYIWNKSNDLVAFSILNNAAQSESLVDIRDRQDKLINSVIESISASENSQNISD